MTHSARARCANFLNTRDDSSLFFCSPWGLKTVLKQQQQFDAKIPIFSKYFFQIFLNAPQTIFIFLGLE